MPWKGQDLRGVRRQRPALAPSKCRHPQGPFLAPKGPGGRAGSLAVASRRERLCSKELLVNGTRRRPAYSPRAAGLVVGYTDDSQWRGPLNFSAFAGWAAGRSARTRPPREQPGPSGDTMSTCTATGKRASSWMLRLRAPAPPSGARLLLAGGPGTRCLLRPRAWLLRRDPRAERRDRGSQVSAPGVLHGEKEPPAW